MSYDLTDKEKTLHAEWKDKESCRNEIIPVIHEALCELETSGKPHGSDGVAIPRLTIIWMLLSQVVNCNDCLENGLLIRMMAQHMAAKHNVLCHPDPPTAFYGWFLVPNNSGEFA